MSATARHYNRSTDLATPSILSPLPSSHRLYQEPFKMGLLADYQALSADDIQLATLNGNVATATTALATANAAVANFQGTVTTATTAVVTDLQNTTLYPSGEAYVLDTTQTPPVVTILSISGTPPTLAISTPPPAQ